VSDEVLSRARRGPQAFGVTPAALKQLAAFNGDATIGAKLVSKTTRSQAGQSRLATAKLSRK
jgi:hypothetical protein